MFTEEQYKTYANYLLEISTEIDEKGFCRNNTTYKNMEKWMRDNKITIDVQNEMDKRFEKDYPIIKLIIKDYLDTFK